MQPFDRIKEYGKTVCNQIRWKKAHFIVSEEIENHIIDQRDAYISSGDDESTATDKAILQMGDPVTVGAQLDRTHRPKPQLDMIGLTVLLLCIGLFIRIFLINDSGRPRLMPTQVIFTLVGMGIMLAAYLADFSLIGKYPKTVYFFVLTLSVIILVISPEINGKAFYAQYPPLMFPIAFIAIIYWTRNKGYLGIILCGAAFIVPALITILVPSVSSFLLFAVSGLFVVCIAVHKNWFGIKRLYGYLFVFVSAFLVLLFASYTMFSKGYLHRLRIAINPSLDPNAGWQAIVTRTLLENSKFIGRGVMPTEYSMWKFPLPGIDTDFLLTYLIFSAGWIAFFIITAVLAVFIIIGFKKCFKQKSDLGLFVSVTVMLTFTLQAVGYIMTNLGFQLFVPIQLPLISYGNVATVFNLALIGFMLSAFRSGDIVRDKTANKYQNYKFISWNDGKLTIYFKK